MQDTKKLCNSEGLTADTKASKEIRALIVDLVGTIMTFPKSTFVKSSPRQRESFALFEWLEADDPVNVVVIVYSALHFELNFLEESLVLRKC